MPPTIHLISALLSIAITALLTSHAWRHRSVPGALSFTWLMAGLTEWSVAYTFLLSTHDPSIKLLWAKIGYLGAASLPLAWLTFAMQYSRFGADRVCRRRWPLGIIPFITVILVFTNEWHHLIWTSTRVVGSDLLVTHGAGYWVFIVYSYLATLFGLGLLLRLFVRASEVYRFQVGAIIVGGLITWLWSFLYLSGNNPIARPEFTPLAVTLSGIAFGWGLFRFRLLDIVPVAREVVIESMKDGMLVLDSQGRIIDLNPAARDILGAPTANYIGAPITRVLPPGCEINLKGETSREEVTFRRGGQAESFELRTSPLTDQHNRLTGTLLLLTDITERKRVEAAEREQRTMAEALRDTAAVLNSTLQLEEVLDRILTNIGRVVPHDAVNIVLLENGVTRMARAQGYVERGLQDQIMEQRLLVKDVQNLKTMIETGQPLVVPDLKAYSGWVDRPESRWVRSYAGAPIRSRGETIGFLHLVSATVNFFTPPHAEFLQAFADQAAIALENARLYAEVQQLALTDGLTGLYNRRGFLEAGRREVEVALRLGRPLSAIMMDIDHFKQVNDSSGHLAGDLALVSLVNTIRESVRSIDVVARYGGDEFVILLIESTYATAAQVAERVRLSVASTQTLTEQGSVQITLSCGVSTLELDSDSLDLLIDRADQALYASKQNGRNCVYGSHELLIEHVG
ncbi:MAG: histidine kinase N-terminal 7TM domain-containing protein [Anaerolineaceae bacterium]|nr:histidine kinase N-terminal 7TM domain-containing protein [Anaerolineaceae bacterium]